MPRKAEAELQSPKKVIGGIPKKVSNMHVSIIILTGRLRNYAREVMQRVMYIYAILCFKETAS